MSFLSNIWQTIVNSEDFSELKSSSFKDILNGNILKKRFIQKQYGLLALIALLIFIYVDNRYTCESQISTQQKLKKELQDIRLESLTVSSELTTLSRRSYVMQYINEKGLDLKESPVAPIIITAPGEKTEADTIKITKHTADTTQSIAQD